jgi:hypothetical protein
MKGLLFLAAIVAVVLRPAIAYEPLIARQLRQPARHRTRRRPIRSASCS